uniref:peroxiredoxin family protein n=1 Tax=Algoriphagus sp. TaxID=1872435 RepID=UPI0025851B4B|nr:redoxin domain-containing protein [Algoriphagus sp.]
MKKIIFGLTFMGLCFSCDAPLSPDQVLEKSKAKILESEQIGFHQTMVWEDPNLGEFDTTLYISFFQKNPNADLGYDFFGKRGEGEFWFVGNVSFWVDHEDREVTVVENETERLSSNSYRSFSPIHLLAQEPLNYKKDTVVNGKTLMEFVWVEMDTVVMEKKVFLENHLFINPANFLPEFLSRRLYHDGKRNQLIEVFYSNYSFDPVSEPLEPRIPQGYVSKADGVEISESKLLAIGEKAPDFRLKDLNGDWVSLEDFRGKKVLLDFSMIHCGWCKIAIDQFKKSSFSFSENVVPLYINPVDEPGKMEKYQSRVGIPFPVLIGAKEVGQAYGVRGYPTFYLIDENGAIELVDEGYSDELIQKLNSKVKTESN